MSTFTSENCYNATRARLLAGTATVVRSPTTTHLPTKSPKKKSRKPFVFAGAVADQHYTEGTAISALQLPEATGGQGDVSYRVFGLPAGLSFDPATRTIAGTPTKATEGAREVAFLAKDSSCSIVLIFAITVNPPMSFGDLSDLFNQAGKAGGLPSRFALADNFPNPFNPHTTIPYALPHQVQVDVGRL